VGARIGAANRTRRRRSVIASGNVLPADRQVDETTGTIRSARSSRIPATSVGLANTVQCAPIPKQLRMPCSSRSERSRRLRQSQVKVVGSDNPHSCGGRSSGSDLDTTVGRRRRHSARRGVVVDAARIQATQASGRPPRSGSNQALSQRLRALAARRTWVLSDALPAHRREAWREPQAGRAAVRAEGTVAADGADAQKPEHMRVGGRHR